MDTFIELTMGWMEKAGVFYSFTNEKKILTCNQKHIDLIEYLKEEHCSLGLVFE